LPDYFSRVAASAPGTPVLAYHYPGVAGAEVPVEALGSLPVQGLKDSSGDAERLLLTLDAWSGWTYVGAAMLTSYAAVLGAAGAILAVANVAPEDCLAAWGGDIAAQRRLLVPHLAARTRFPHGLKAEMARRFGTPVTARIG
ncbi:MAG TPA: dihydrodipicolinate synthase family protein, partial [Cryptosporangiaceae bacterium]|nr:dihydrodipicolinate synthase family protein [Cryptosporangiaceae bacterium]